MEMTLFRAQGATDIDNLPKVVNSWLGKLPNTVEVKHVTTAMTAGPPGGNNIPFPVLVITVWWDRR
jgi:hypothetical protein